MAPFLSPGYLRKTPEDHPKKTYGKKGIKRQKTQNKLTRKTPLEPGASSTTKKNAPEDDHKTVLKSKSKNIKTAAKQRITRQKTPNKLTSKTPLEPGSSSTVKKNVLLPGSSSEEDKLWDETVASVELSFMLKPVPPVYDYHDHNQCIAEELGLDNGVPIPACFAKYFDDEAMVPLKVQPSSPSDSDLGTFDPFSWSPYESSDDVDFLSPPSDGEVVGLESNDAPIDLGGPMTRSKTKKLYEEVVKQLEEDLKRADSMELPEYIG